MQVVQPQCCWLGDRRVLLLGPAPGNSDLLSVYIEGEERLLPADTVFEQRTEAAAAEAQRSADYYDLEARLWNVADKLQLRCLARQAALQGLPVPERFRDIPMASEQEVQAMLARAERRRGHRRRPERADVKRRAALQAQREKAAALLEQQAREEQRRKLQEQQQRERQQQQQREQQQQQRLNVSIDELLQQVWAGQAGS